MIETTEEHDYALKRDELIVGIEELIDADESKPRGLHYITSTTDALLLFMEQYFEKPEAYTNNALARLAVLAFMGPNQTLHGQHRDNQVRAALNGIPNEALSPTTLSCQLKIPTPTKAAAARGASYDRSSFEYQFHSMAVALVTAASNILGIGLDEWNLIFDTTDIAAHIRKNKPKHLTPEQAKHWRNTELSREAHLQFHNDKHESGKGKVQVHKGTPHGTAEFVAILHHDDGNLAFPIWISQYHGRDLLGRTEEFLDAMAKLDFKPRTILADRAFSASSRIVDLIFNYANPRGTWAIMLQYKPRLSRLKQEWARVCQMNGDQRQAHRVARFNQVKLAKARKGGRRYRMEAAYSSYFTVRKGKWSKDAQGGRYDFHEVRVYEHDARPKLLTKKVKVPGPDGQEIEQKVQYWAAKRGSLVQDPIHPITGEQQLAYSGITFISNHEPTPQTQANSTIAWFIDQPPKRWFVELFLKKAHNNFGRYEGPSMYRRRLVFLQACLAIGFHSLWRALESNHYPEDDVRHIKRTSDKLGQKSFIAAIRKLLEFS